MLMKTFRCSAVEPCSRTGGHTCPIHPNRYDSSTVVDESTHRTWNRALTYWKWREYSLSVLQIDFRCDGSTLTGTFQVDSSRIESIRQHPQSYLVTTYRIFSECLANRPLV